MPYSPHPSLEEPDPNARLWRYMDLAKLVSILVDKSLFFPSGKALSGSDKFEGQPTYAEVDLVKALAAPATELKTYEDHVLKAFGEAAPADQIKQMKTIEEIVFFHCWHMNDDESDAM